jgi:hypothetical protein
VSVIRPEVDQLPAVAAGAVSWRKVLSSVFGTACYGWALPRRADFLVRYAFDFRLSQIHRHPRGSLSYACSARAGVRWLRSRSRSPQPSARGSFGDSSVNAVACVGAAGPAATGRGVAVPRYRGGRPAIGAPAGPPTSRSQNGLSTRRRVGGGGTEDKPVALDGLADLAADPRAGDRSGVDEGVDLAILAARFDLRRKIREQFGVEPATGGRPIELAGVDTEVSGHLRWLTRIQLRTTLCMSVASKGPSSRGRLSEPRSQIQDAEKVRLMREVNVVTSPQLAHDRLEVHKAGEVAAVTGIVRPEAANFSDDYLVSGNSIS